MRHKLAAGALGLLPLAAIPSCSTELDPIDEETARSTRVDAIFNYPGSSQQTGYDTEADDILVQMIDRADASIDFAVMGFSQDSVVDALERAYFRGIELRFVGDAKHMHGFGSGYTVMDGLEVPHQMGNQNHIMHNKFYIVDRRFVLTGTGNITPTGFQRNDNNWVMIDHPGVAEKFQAEFEQMFEGRFGFAKQRNFVENTYQVGDTEVEVRFSPHEDPLGRMFEEIETAEESIEFFIFAFTKDQIGSLFIQKHLEFTRYNQCCDPAVSDDARPDDCGAVECKSPFRRKWVRGVIDRSQLHSNGPYHEVYRLLAFGVPMVMDGNDNARQPGDYQAGGGRQHSKTMVIDGLTENGRVLTGSFNWSSSATIANDETLLTLRGPRLAGQYTEYFSYLWNLGKTMGERFIADDDLRRGAVVFNEIHWDGFNGLQDASDAGEDVTYNDEFIELLNTTNQVIDMSLWTVATDHDFLMGFFPGTVIGPYERFLVVDHNTIPFNDVTPHEQGGAFLNANFVMNTANDQRFLRLNLSDTNFRLRLLDPKARVMDVAGDGGVPFFGGPSPDQDGIYRNRSMERIHFDDGDTIRDGSQRSSWRACSADQGGANVSQQLLTDAALQNGLSPTERDSARGAGGINACDDNAQSCPSDLTFQDIILATPGEPNSGGEQFPEPDPDFREPAN